MPNDMQPQRESNDTGTQRPNNGAQREDEAMPAASEDRVLDETARLAREGQRELESDPREKGSRSER